MNVYPNPATDQLTVVFLSDFDMVEKARVKMMDFTGKFVMEQELEALGRLHQLDLEVEGFAPGVYIVKVESGAVRKRKRIIIQ